MSLGRFSFTYVYWVVRLGTTTAATRTWTATDTACVAATRDR